jgi:hypothetical protein
MVFLIGILIAVVFAVSAVKLGLYHAWSLLFSVLVSVYLGIRLGPFIEDFIPTGGGYNTTLGILAAGLGTFAVLHGISYAFLIGQFDVNFPHAIGKLGSAVFGFLTGFLVWSFLLLLVCAAPFSQNKYFKDIGVSCDGFEQIHEHSYLIWWCSVLDKLVGSGDADTEAKQAIAGLLFKPSMSAKRPDANEPNLTAIPLHPAITPAHESNEALPP